MALKTARLPDGTVSVPYLPELDPLYGKTVKPDDPIFTLTPPRWVALAGAKYSMRLGWIITPPGHSWPDDECNIYGSGWIDIGNMAPKPGSFYGSVEGCYYWAATSAAELIYAWAWHDRWADPWAFSVCTMNTSTDYFGRYFRQLDENIIVESFRTVFSENGDSLGTNDALVYKSGTKWMLKLIGLKTPAADIEIPSGDPILRNGHIGEYPAGGYIATINGVEYPCVDRAELVRVCRFFVREFPLDIYLFTESIDLFSRGLFSIKVFRRDATGVRFLGFKSDARRTMYMLPTASYEFLIVRDPAETPIDSIARVIDLFAGRVRFRLLIHDIANKRVNYIRNHNGNYAGPDLNPAITTWFRFALKDSLKTVDDITDVLMVLNGTEEIVFSIDADGTTVSQNSGKPPLPFIGDVVASAADVFIGQTVNRETAGFRLDTRFLALKYCRSGAEITGVPCQFAFSSAPEYTEIMRGYCFQHGGIEGGDGKCRTLAMSAADPFAVELDNYCRDPKNIGRTGGVCREYMNTPARGSKFDSTMREYCASAPRDKFCGCTLSYLEQFYPQSEDPAAQLIRGKMLSAPSCLIGECKLEGYKFASDLATQCSGDVQVCSIDIANVGAGSATSGVSCAQQIEKTTVTTPPATTPPATTPPATTPPATTPPSTTASPKVKTPTAGLSAALARWGISMTMFILIIAAFVIIAILVAMDGKLN